MHKILIVDDEPNIRQLLYESLEEFECNGSKILSAANGKDAWELIKKEEPDLVYLDIMLPEINGYEICRKIKSDKNLQKIIVAILTAKGQEMDKKKGIEIGADTYITKPFDPDFIVLKTSEFLGTVHNY